MEIFCRQAVASSRRKLVATNAADRLRPLQRMASAGHGYLHVAPKRYLVAAAWLPVQLPTSSGTLVQYFGGTHLRWQSSSSAATAAPQGRHTQAVVIPLQAPKAKDGLKGTFTYSAGRLPAIGSWLAQKIRPSRSKFIAKLQALLDLSDDARGGMGQMTPATLLLYDEGKAMVRLVTEEETGHTALMRLAIKHKDSKVYVNCETFELITSHKATRY